MARSEAAVSVLKYGLRVPGANIPNPCNNTLVLKCILKCKGIKHCSKHSHVVCRRPFHPGRSCPKPPEYITAAYDDSYINPGVVYTLNLICYGVNNLGINTITFFTHQGLAADLQKYPFKSFFLRHF